MTLLSFINKSTIQWHLVTLVLATITFYARKWISCLSHQNERDLCWNYTERYETNRLKLIENVTQIQMDYGMWMDVFVIGGDNKSLRNQHFLMVYIHNSIEFFYLFLFVTFIRTTYISYWNTEGNCQKMKMWLNFTKRVE